HAARTAQIACGGASISAAVSTVTVPLSMLVRTAISPASIASRSIHSRSASSPAAVPTNASSAPSTRPRDAAASTSVRLIDDRILELADAVDLDLDPVAGPDPQRRLASRAHAARRAGRDDVARLEHGEGRAIRDQLRHVEIE